MAHSGNPLDKAPLIKSIDISGVARQRPAKVKKPRVVNTTPKNVENNPTTDTVVCLTKTPSVIMAEPLPVLKGESRFSTELEQIILNILDDKLGYYVDKYLHVYRFEGADLIVVGKYVINRPKLDRLTDDETKTITTRLRVRYTYDNNYFIVETPSTTT